MNHERLWAPWRLGYVKGDRTPPNPSAEPQLPPDADAGCFLCRAVAERRDRENLVIERGRHTVVMLNRYPYNNGHLLVACQRHVGQLDELSVEANAEAVETIARLTGLIAGAMNADGFNVGLNLGKAAGAGVPGHLHWHVVPRWQGDTNFMPVLAGVDVIPQALDELWSVLTDALASQPKRTGP